MRKNDAFVVKIVNTRLTKGFMAIFAPAESLPSPATLVTGALVLDAVPAHRFCEMPWCATQQCTITVVYHRQQCTNGVEYHRHYRH